MKLYYAPGACSLSPHIVSYELQLPLELVKVDTKNKTTEHGEDYLNISPKGYVPALVLDDGSLLTEGPVLVQYLSDLANDTELMPAAKTKERYQALEVLNCITSELHKSFTPLFSPKANNEVKAFARDKVNDRITLLQTQILGDKPYLLGDKFSVCDAYCFTVLNWTNFVDIELPEPLKAYQQRIASRPAVQEAMKAEGLIQ